MNYYPHHIGDFRSGTHNMERLERWIYRDMLDVYYDTEQPFPLDLDQVCMAVGVRRDDEKQLVVGILKFKFEQTEEGWRHKRCDEEIARYHNKAEKAKANGKLGGRPPKQTEKEAEQNPTETQSVSLANPDLTGSEANQEPRTNNQEPVTKKKKKASADADPYLRELALGVLDYLNLKAGRAFEPTDKNLGYILARMGEGASVDQCRAVVDFKVKGWLGDPKMDEYLRPSTLFNSEKFSDYAAAASAPKPQQTIRPPHDQSNPPISRLGKAGQETAAAAQRLLEKMRRESEQTN